MLLRSLIAAILLLSAAPSVAEEYETTALGLRVALSSAGDAHNLWTVEVTGVVAYGPAWRAGIMVGDLLQQPLDRFRRHRDRESLEEREGERRFLANRIFLAADGSIPRNPAIEPMVLREQYYLPGPWIEERISLEDFVARGLDEAETQRMTAFFDDALREIAGFGCQGRGLVRTAKSRYDKLRFIADGFNQAGFPRDSIEFAMARRARLEACQTESAQPFIQARIADFEAARETPREALIEIEELGVRLREVAVPFRAVGPRRVLQIHSVREFGPIWRVRGVKPGDYIDGISLRALQEKVDRNRRLGRFARISLQFTTLEAEVPEREERSATMVTTAPDGRWLNDAKTVEERASDPVNRAIAARFDAEVEAAKAEMRAMACAATNPDNVFTVRQIDDLALAAGRPAPVALSTKLREMAAAACLRAEGGPTDAQYEAIAAVQWVQDCAALDDLSGPIGAVRDSLTAPGYDSYTETTMRLFMRDRPAETKACVIDHIAEMFHAGTQ
ncbi:MAG: hypothetical protein AAFQ88_02845 [Pseudomonadota bacterium]